MTTLWVPEAETPTVSGDTTFLDLIAIVNESSKNTNKYREKIFPGDGSTTIYALEEDGVVYDNLVVTIDDVVQTEETDYVFDVDTNVVEFSSAPEDNTVVKFVYNYKLYTDENVKNAINEAIDYSGKYFYKVKTFVKNIFTNLIYEYPLPPFAEKVSKVEILRGTQWSKMNGWVTIYLETYYVTSDQTTYLGDTTSTSLVLGEGESYDVSVNDYLKDINKSEVVRVSDIDYDTDTLTVERGAVGTAAEGHAASVTWKRWNTKALKFTNCFYPYRMRITYQSRPEPLVNDMDTLEIVSGIPRRALNGIKHYACYSLLQQRADYRIRNDAVMNQKEGYIYPSDIEAAIQRRRLAAEVAFQSCSMNPQMSRVTYNES